MSLLSYAMKSTKSLLLPLLKSHPSFTIVDDGRLVSPSLFCKELTASAIMAINTWWVYYCNENEIHYYINNPELHFAEFKF